MKKFAALAMAAIIAFPAQVLAVTDERIFTDDVQNTYVGREEVTELISTLNYSDVPANHWAQESIVRGGSLNIIKGMGGSTFAPDSFVSNQEALAFVIRMIGRESEALQAGAMLQNDLTASSGLYNLWSIGYIYTAMTAGIITNAEYNQLLAEDGTTVDAQSLTRSSPVTRERLAQWTATALNATVPGTLDLTGDKLALYTFSDFDNVAVEYAAAVNAVAAKGIMNGDTSGNFNPKSGLTRAQMAQVLRNMGDIYYAMNNIERKTGTVGGYRDNNEFETGMGDGWRNFHIRTGTGGIDVLQYRRTVNITTPERILETVVYKNGRANGLQSLAEGDQIEYLVNAQTGQVLYVEVLNSGNQQATVEGTLHSVNMAEGTITIQDIAQKSYVYQMMDGVYGTDKDIDGKDALSYIMIDLKKQDVKDLPIGYNLQLNLISNVVESINFIGNIVLVTEDRGLVIENSPEFGYLSFIDVNGNIVTKNYYADSIRVSKQQYYDLEDEIGYIAQMFPNFKYNPRESDISEIEPGDIIFVRYSDDDPELIVNMSAATNYVAMYGQIKQINQGDDVTRYLIEFENKQTSWFDAANSIFISKEGVPVRYTSVQVGDWGRFLVNQAIIMPGYVMESLKEIALEGDAHYISTILKGQVAGVDYMQKQLMVQNIQSLEKTGWVNYQQLQQYALTSTDIEYYYEGQRVSLDYVEKFLKRADGDVYIALENAAQGERIKKVSFRSGRDEILGADTVISADGNGSFSIISNSGSILTDSGTIVRRHGRLVDGSTILASDYLTVSLNGGSTAAIVDIVDSPDTSNLMMMIGRGRVLSVDEGKSFKVQSMSILQGQEWVFTPVQREFTIDYSTIFINEGGYTDMSNFLDYTDETVVNKVYNIIYDGSKATHVVEAPYPNSMVRGTIYSKEGDTFMIKEAQFYENTTGKWINVSRENSILSITVPVNSIVARSNSVVTPSGLVVGDTIKVMTNDLPDEVKPGDSVDGYIVFVEN